MLREGALLVDVRERDEIAAAAFGVEEVLVLPLSEAEGHLEELPRDRPIIWACRSGRRSRQIGEALWPQGFDRAVNLEGGIIAWARAGLPVKAGGEGESERSARAPAPGR